MSYIVIRDTYRSIIVIPGHAAWIIAAGLASTSYPTQRSPPAQIRRKDAASKTAPRPSRIWKSLAGNEIEWKVIQLYRMLSTCSDAEPMQVLFIWNIWLMQPAVGRLCAGKVLQELQDDGFYAGFPWDLVPTSFLHLHGKERTMCLGSGCEISPSVPLRTPEKVKVEIGITESCIYWCHDMMVRSKVDGLVAHGLCPQFQDWHLSLNLGQLVWWASLKLSPHIEYPYILQYSKWILPYLSMEKTSSLLGKVKIFLPTNACSSWEWNLLTSQRWKAVFSQLGMLFAALAGCDGHLLRPEQVLCWAQRT